MFVEFVNIIEFDQYYKRMFLKLALTNSCKIGPPSNMYGASQLSLDGRYQGKKDWRVGF